jgi:type I restriction enzyme, S subunit
MSWPVVKLSDLCRVKHGYAFKSRYFESDGPYVLMTPGSFNEEGGYRDQGEKRKFYAGDIPDGFILDEGDLLIAMTEQAPGLLGSSAWIPESNRFLHNQRLGRVVDLDEHRLYKRFLYYLFNTREVRHQISASATGTKVRHTAPERIGRVVVSLPPHKVQTWIAGILSAYDDLIENNRRRMALLEEAARQLYREWFVRLRFPGHEHTRITNGLPEGWEREPLGDRVTLNYGKALKAEDRCEGPCPVYGSSGIVGRHEKALAAAPGIVVGRKGNVGRVYWCQKDYWPIDTVYFIDAKTSNLWLFYALRHMHFISTDVAVPGLNRDFAYSRPLLVPEPRIVRNFLDTAAPLHEQIARLDEMNERLRAARDLLLPRLMSGEIAV